MRFWLLRYSAIFRIIASYQSQTLVMVLLFFLDDFFFRYINSPIWSLNISIVLAPQVTDQIEVAYCSTFNKYKEIAISILSIMKRTQSKVHFTIFFPIMITNQTTIFEKIQQKYTHCSITFRFLAVSVVDAMFPYKWVNYWHQYMFVRVIMIDILTDLDKVLYLDTDVIGCGDIKAIYDVPLLEKDCLIAGAPDALPDRKWMSNRYMAVMGLNKHTYLNSGVLLMNLKGLREMDFVKKSVEWWKSNENTRFPDQDMINYLVGPKRRIVLDRKFNKAWHGNFCDCILRHYNHIKVTDPQVYRGFADYHYYFESLDEFKCLMNSNC